MVKIQKQLSNKGKKKYYKYVVILPNRAIKKAKFRKGSNLKVEVEVGEIKLKKK